MKLLDRSIEKIHAKLLFMWSTPVLEQFQGILKLCAGKILFTQAFILCILVVRLTEGDHGTLLFWKERRWQILSSEGWYCKWIFYNLLFSISGCAWDCLKKDGTMWYDSFLEFLTKQSVSTKYLKATKETFRTLPFATTLYQHNGCSQMSAFNTVPTYWNMSK